MSPTSSKIVVVVVVEVQLVGSDGWSTQPRMIIYQEIYREMPRVLEMPQEATNTSVATVSRPEFEKLTDSEFEEYVVQSSLFLL